MITYLDSSFIYSVIWIYPIHDIIFHLYLSFPKIHSGSFNLMQIVMVYFYFDIDSHLLNLVNYLLFYWNLVLLLNLFNHRYPSSYLNF